MRIDMIVKYEMYLDMEEFEMLYQYTGEKVAYGYSVVNEDGEELVKIVLTEEMLDEIKDIIEQEAYEVEEEYGYTAASELRDLSNAIYMANLWN